MFYIAYGSNMNTDGMSRLAPNSHFVSTGKINGWKLVFKTHADIVEDETAESLPVVIWDIDEADWPSLDHYEGYPSYYNYKMITAVRDDTSEEVEALVYVMNAFPVERPCPPSDAYFGVIETACHQHGFDVKYLYEARNESMGGGVMDIESHI